MGHTQQGHRDAKLLNDKEVMTRNLAVEQRVLAGSLQTVSSIQNLFTRNMLKWMARSMELYSKEIVRENYTPYVAAL